ncbi:hypothetical protein SAMN05421791_1011 [Facklamia miroungae]|uniref:DUF5673 domain-containing protein n=1 Tax=Facklamia miroungae TaxID=120956 RepID=A0A1G7NU10_9LACT|nr:hypothetical protein SAMN05421791_1011 [Facklamia miroungae]
MLKILLIIIFIIGSIHNFYIAKENDVYISRKKILTTLLIIFGLVSFYLCYTLDNTILGYITVASAITYLISFTFTPGIGKDGVTIMMGSTTLIKNAKFNDIKNIKYKETDNEDFKVIINVFGNEYHQFYKNRDKNKVVELLKNVKRI